MALAFSSGVPKSGAMEIGIAIVLHDRFSNAAAQASNQIKKLQQDARMAVQANLQTAYSIGSMGVNMFGGIANHLLSAVTYGNEFIDTMTTVNAITQASQESMDKLNEVALSLGEHTMFSSQDIASGMKYLAMAGNTAEEIQAMIKGATYAAGATGLALGGKGGAADVITNVMRTFQLSGEKAAYWVGDVMTNATLSANISMTDLAASIRYAAADMTNLGYDLPEVTAAIGTLGNMGIQGSMAGTALANMVRYLNKSISDPSYKGHKYLTQIGLSKEDLTTSDGHLKSLYDIITKLKQATAGLDPTELSLVSTGIFGVRGNRAAMALLRDTENYSRLFDKIAGTEPGAAQKVVDAKMNTLAGQVNVLKSLWQNLKVSVTQALTRFIPVLKVVSHWVNGLAKFFQTGVGKFVVGLGVAITVVGLFTSKIMILTSRFRMLQLDSQVTGRNMLATLTMAWRGVNVQTEHYLRLLTIIQAQQMAGVAMPGMMGGVPIGAGAMYRGTRIRPIVSPQGGIVYSVSGKGAGSKFVSTAPFTAKAAADIERTAAAGGKAAKNVLGTMSVGGRFAAAGGKLAGGLIGVLANPWVGLAIMGISIALPLVTNALNKNKDRLENNSDNIKENTTAVNGLTRKYEEEANKLMSAREREHLLTIINLMGRIIGNQGRYPKINIQPALAGYTPSPQYSSEPQIDK